MRAGWSGRCRVRVSPNLPVWLGLIVVLGILAGCSPSSQRAPDRIVADPHASGSGQTGLHGEVLPLPLKVVVESAEERGLLGGKGSRHPIPGVDVQFAIENPA